MQQATDTSNSKHGHRSENTCRHLPVDSLKHNLIGFMLHPSQTLVKFAIDIPNSMLMLCPNSSGPTVTYDRPIKSMCPLFPAIRHCHRLGW